MMNKEQIKRDVLNDSEFSMFWLEESPEHLIMRKKLINKILEKAEEEKDKEIYWYGEQLKQERKEKQENIRKLKKEFKAGNTYDINEIEEKINKIFGFDNISYIGIGEN